MNSQYWLIEIEEGVKKRKSLEVPTGQITENGLFKLITTLICKYTLGDEEILEIFCKKNTKKIKEYFKIKRYSSRTDKVHIIYDVKCTNISISATLEYR